GWLGAVLVFLVVAASGLAGDGAPARGAYLTLQVIGWRVIVPLCLASLASGLVQSLGTKWGLVRHYWVGIKLVLTVLATGFLLLTRGRGDELGGLGEAGDLTAGHALRIQLVVDSAAALVVLVVATVLAVFKPRGMTPRWLARGPGESRR